MAGARSMREDAEQVLGVEHADDVIDGVGVDGNARLAALDDDLHGVVEGGVGLDGDHVDARHHDLADGGVGELEDVVDHLALVFFEHALLLADLDQQAQLVFGDERAALDRGAAEQAHDAVGDEHQHAHQRAEHATEHLDGADEDAGAAFGRLHRPGFGGDLAEDQHDQREDDRRNDARRSPPKMLMAMMVATVEAVMTATLLVTRMAERKRSGFSIRRRMRWAGASPSSASLRMRRRLTEVSAVSAAAEKPARTQRR